MEILQKIYIMILNPIYSLIGNIPKKSRNVILGLLCFLLVSVLFFWYSMYAFHKQPAIQWKVLLGTVLLFLIILFSIDGKLKPVKWNNLFAIPWMVCGIVIVITSFLHPVGSGFRYWGLDMAVGFPCLYFVWQNRNDYQTFFRIFSKAVVYAFLMFSIFYIVMEFYGYNSWFAQRFGATTKDANRLGEICVMVSVAAFYLLLNRKNKPIFPILSLGFVFGFTVLSASRSSLLSLAAITILFLSFALKENELSMFDRIKKCILLILPIVIIASGISIIMPKIHNSVVEEGTQKTVLSQDSATTTVEQPATEVAQNRFEGEGLDLNQFSAGRIHIWAEYAQYINVLGNEQHEGQMINETVGHYSAHNIFLEYTYRSGILAGITIIIVEILAGIFCVRVFFTRKRNEYDAFTAMAGAQFIIVSNLQVTYIPFTSMSMLVFVMGAMVMFNKREKKSIQKDI